MVTALQLQALLAEYKELAHSQQNSSTRQGHPLVPILQIVAMVIFVSTQLPSSEKDEYNMHKMALALVLFLLSKGVTVYATARPDLNSTFIQLQKQVEQATSLQQKEACAAQLRAEIKKLYDQAAPKLLELLQKQAFAIVHTSHAHEVIALNYPTYLGDLVKNASKEAIQRAYQCEDDSAEALANEYKLLVPLAIANQPISTDSLDMILDTLAEIVDQDWAAQKRILTGRSMGRS